MGINCMLLPISGEYLADIFNTLVSKTMHYFECVALLERVYLVLWYLNSEKGGLWEHIKHGIRRVVLMALPLRLFNLNCQDLNIWAFWIINSLPISSVCIKNSASCSFFSTKLPYLGGRHYIHTKPAFLQQQQNANFKDLLRSKKLLKD